MTSNNTSTNLQKHKSINPLQQWLINRFYHKLLSTIKELPITTILDAGCGEGFTISRLQQVFPDTYDIQGIDSSQQAINIASQNISPKIFHQANIYSLPYPDNNFDLVICTEVLEHLEDPAAALAQIHRVSKKYALLSVPHEPFFRAANFLRGKHIMRLGNTTEHIQHWSGQSFQKYVSMHGFTVLKKTHPFPWTMLLASPNN